MKSEIPHITFDTPVEDVALRYPKAVHFLTERHVRCIRCGEPLWCSMGELFEQDGVTEPQSLLDDLNDYLRDIYAPKFSITGHRGASGSAPENTLAALEEAISQGADCIEFDVQPTADGEIVIFHDDTLDRTTNGTGPLIEKRWDELKNLDAGSWFDSRFSDEKIPLFTQAIELVKGRISLNIEIKIDRLDETFLKKLVRIVCDQGIADQCILSSFHRPSVEFVRSLDPSLKTGFIFFEFAEPVKNILESPFEVLSSHFQLITNDFVSRAHAQSKEVHVWTVNEPQDMAQMIDSGVDNIITNYPCELVKIRDGGE